MRTIIIFFLILLIGLTGYSQKKVQCLGLTKQEIKCKNKTLNVNQYCYLHQSQVPVKVPQPEEIETVTIGFQTWMAHNLNVGVKIQSNVPQGNNTTIEKYCYNNDEANCTEYGGWYQWGELMNYATAENTQGICPTGFHIPSHAEYMTLINELGGESMAGPRMNEAGNIHWNMDHMLPNQYSPTWQYYGGRSQYGEHPTWWLPDNSSGFGAVGNGYIKNGGYSMRLGLQSSFWTSSMKTAYSVNPIVYEYARLDPTLYNIFITTSNWLPEAVPLMTYQNNAYAVRCIKD